MKPERTMNEEQNRREFERDCQRRYEAEKNALDLGHNVITHIDQLDGWRITGLRRWKEGVVQYTAFRKTVASAEQKIGYAKDEVFAHLQIPSQNGSGEGQREKGASDAN
jgi:hypothetical protein